MESQRPHSDSAAGCAAVVAGTFGFLAVPFAAVAVVATATAANGRWGSADGFLLGVGAVVGAAACETAAFLLTSCFAFRSGRPIRGAAFALLGMHAAAAALGILWALGHYTASV